jgi:hypothetical protein
MWGDCDMNPAAHADVTVWILCTGAVAVDVLIAPNVAVMGWLGWIWKHMVWRMVRKARELG